MSETIERRVAYNVQVEMAWRAVCVSPITGQVIERYGSDVETVRRLVDLALVSEAHHAGLTVTGRFDPQEPTS